MPKLLWNLMISLEKSDWTVNSKFKVRQIGFTAEFKLVFFNDCGDEIVARKFYPTDIEISKVSVDFDTESAFIEFK